MTEVEVAGDARGSELFRLTTRSPIHMEVPEDLSYDDWYRLTTVTGLFHLQSEWWLIDLLAFGERKWEETYAQIGAELNVAAQTLANMVSVGRRVPPAERHEELTVGHHSEVASLSPPERARLLEKAASAGWTRDELRDAKRAVRGGKSADEAEPTPKGICPTCGGATIEVVNPDGETIIKRA